MSAGQNLSALLPANLSQYDYMRLLSRPFFAWEVLRRNADYRRCWHLSTPGRPPAISLNTGATLQRTRRRFAEAEAWGLSMFC